MGSLLSLQMGGNVEISTPINLRLDRNTNAFNRGLTLWIKLKNQNNSVHMNSQTT